MNIDCNNVSRRVVSNALSAAATELQRALDQVAGYRRCAGREIGSIEECDHVNSADLSKLELRVEQLWRDVDSLFWELRVVSIPSEAAIGELNALRTAAREKAEGRHA